MADLKQVAATDDPAIAKRIELELLASLRHINRQAPTHRQTFCINDAHGDLKAGLTCATAYGWLHIETLWVAEPHRSEGFGRKLMSAAEAFGRDHGCHSAWLDTSNPEADAFYRRLGYTEFGELKNGEGQFPPEHRRRFLRRTL